MATANGFYGKAPKAFTAQEMAAHRAQLAEYRSGGFGSGFFPQAIDGKPWFTLYDVERMRREPAVRMGLKILKGAIRKVKFDVVADDPRVEKFVREMVSRTWPRLVPHLGKFFEYGRVVGETEYRWLGGRLGFGHFWEAHAFDGLPLVYTKGPDRGRLAGISIRNRSGSRTFDDTPGGGEVRLYPPYSFWYSGPGDGGALWSSPRIAGAFEPFLELDARDGARDDRRLWFRKCAFDGPGVGFPVGETNIGTQDSPTYRANQDIALEVAEKRESGAAWVYPLEYDEEGREKWRFHEPSARPDVAGLLDYPKDLMDEIWLGMGIPPEIVRASETGSGYSGRSIPAMAFYGGIDEDVGPMAEAVDEQIWNPCVVATFGEGVHYEVYPVPLVETIGEEEGGSAGIGGGAGPAMAGLWGGEQEPEQPPPQQQPQEADLGVGKEMSVAGTGPTKAPAPATPAAAPRETASNEKPTTPDGRLNMNFGNWSFGSYNTADRPRHMEEDAPFRQFRPDDKENYPLSAEFASSIGSGPRLKGQELVDAYDAHNSVDGLHPVFGVHYVVKYSHNKHLPEEARPEMSAHEARAMNHYSYGGDGKINAVLRGRKDHGADHINAVAHDHLQEIFGRLEPFKKPTNVYRGVSFDGDEEALGRFVEHLKGVHEKGDDIVMPGYSSTSTDRHFIQKHFASDPRSSVLFEIKAKKGLDMQPFSMFQMEKELLLNHNSRFRILGISKDGWNRHVVRMEHVLDDSGEEK